MKFTEYAQSRDDSVRRYVAYLANKHDETLEEAAIRSMARIWQQMDDDKHHALISAFRDERPLEDNRNLNIALASDIRSNGWGYTPVLGGFREKVRDDLGEPTGEEKDVDEESYFLTSADDKDKFRKAVLELVLKYDQESAIVKYADDPIAYFLKDDGNQDPAGEWKADRLAQYYTKMKRGPENRKFTFEAAGDLTRTTRMVVDRMFQEFEV